MHQSYPGAKGLGNNSGVRDYAFGKGRAVKGNKDMIEHGNLLFIACFFLHENTIQLIYINQHKTYMMPGQPEFFGNEIFASGFSNLINHLIAALYQFSG
jgi:hypothetical protein